MKNETIYSIYGVKNKEELYLKLKKTPEEMKDLIEILEKLGKTRTREVETLRNPKELADYINKNEYNSTTLIGLNSQLEVVGEVSLKSKDYRNLKKEIIENSLINNYKSFMLVEPSNKTINFEKLKRECGLFEIQGLDYVNIGEKHIHKETGEIEVSEYITTYSGVKVYKSKEEPKLERLKNEEEKKFYNTNKVEEFLNHYINKELKGLSIEKDESEIKTLLMIELSEKPIERFSIIFTDKNNKILEKVDLQNGTIDRSTIYIREVAKEIIKQDKAVGALILHNHPAGSIKPSDADIELTKKLKEIFNSLDKKLYNHYIISRNGRLDLKFDSEIGLLDTKLKFDIMEKKAVNKKKNKEIER